MILMHDKRARIFMRGEFMDGFDVANEMGNFIHGLFMPDAR